MKKTLLGCSVFTLAFFFITSCKKQEDLKEPNNNPIVKDTTTTVPKDTTVTTPKDTTLTLPKDSTINSGDTTTTVPVEVKPLNLYMTDYYPDSFYQNYAALKIVNDQNNLYITLTGLNEFKVKKAKLLVGSLDHLQAVLSPYTHPAVSEVGPDPSDYAQSFTEASRDTYTFTIVKSGIKENSVFIYAWAYVERYDTEGNKTDWRSIWSRSSQNVNGDAATSYFQYTMQ